MILASLFISLCLAQEPSIMPFKAWKEQQLVEARNQVVRLNNKIALEKEVDPKIELEVQRANETFQSAKELSLAEYSAAYLAKFRNQPQALSALVKRLSKQETSELLYVLLNPQADELSGAISPNH